MHFAVAHFSINDLNFNVVWLYMNFDYCNSNLKIEIIIFVFTWLDVPFQSHIYTGLWLSLGHLLTWFGRLSGVQLLKCCQPWIREHRAWKLSSFYTTVPFHIYTCRNKTYFYNSVMQISASMWMQRHWC